MAIFEVLNNQQSYFNRYFRRNEGSTDYATIPAVTLAGDFVIECDFTFDENSNSKLLGHTSGSAAGLLGVDMDGNVVVRHSGTWASLGVVPNLITGVLYKAVLSRVGGVISASVGGVNAPSNTSYSGNWIISQLSRAFGSGGYEYLAGILANLKIYDAGTLVRNYPINDNSSTIRDLANGQNGTIINGNASDWGLFDRQANGDWLGQELLSSNDISAIPWTVTASGDLELGENLIKLTNTMATEAQVTTGLSATIGAKYRVVNTTATSGSWASSGFEQGRASLITLQNPLETVATSSSPQLRYGTNLANIGGTVTLPGPVSIKEVLKNA